MKAQGGWERTSTTSWEDVEMREYGMKGGSSWRGFHVEQKVFGLCSVTIGTEVIEPLQPRIDRRERILEVILKLQE